MASNASHPSQRPSESSLPQHLRTPSLPPPTGPLPPTPGASQQAHPLKPTVGSPDRLIGRPFLPSSSLPLWSTKRPDASLQSIRTRTPTTLPYKPSTPARDWARHSRSGSDYRRATVVDRRLVQEQELGQGKSGERPGLISPSYPSSATLQDSLGSSSSSSQNNVPLSIPPIPSNNNFGDGLEKVSSSYSNSIKSGSSKASSHHRSLSQPTRTLSSSIRRWFSPSQSPEDIESGADATTTVDPLGSSHRRNASSTVPQSQTFYSMSTSDEAGAADAYSMNESHKPPFIANFSRKPLKSIPDYEFPRSNESDAPPDSQVTTRAGFSQSQFHTVPSPNSNRTMTSSSGSGLEFGYVPFLTESGHSFPRSNTDRSNRGSQSSRRVSAAGVSTDDIVRDLRSLSRLSGLSHVSGGAAFIISEDGDGAEYITGSRSDFENPPPPLPRVGQPRVEAAQGPVYVTQRAPVDSDHNNSLPAHQNRSEFSNNAPSSYLDDEHMLEKSESGVTTSNSEGNRRSSTSSDHHSQEDILPNMGFRQLTPANMRVHPADQRYSHTYRVRQFNGDDPVLIPVYNFPTPGAFPNRNHLTMPNANPALAKHTRAADSIDIFDGAAPSNESQERLIPEHLTTSFKHQPNNSPLDLHSKEKYTKTGAAAIMTNAKRSENDAYGEARDTATKYRTRDSIADTNDPSAQNTKSNIRSPSIPATQPKKMTGKERFDREHDSDIIAPVVTNDTAEDVRQHPGKTHFTDLGSSPHLFRAQATYSGDDIDNERWPDRFSRQQKIGRYMLVMCIFLPPLWIVLAAGGLDIFVNELTEGEIWAVGRKEKKTGAILGSSFFAGLLVAIITVGVIVL